MSDEIQRVPLSKKGERKVTPFTGNELLFDYVTGVLDEERKRAVAAHLENSREAQLDLQKIQTGLQYAERLKSITVSSALHETLNTPSSYLSVLFRKARFDQWPVGIKWGLEALVVVFVIVTVLSLAPWEKVLKLRLSGTNEVVLTELNKAALKEASHEEIPKTTETPQFVDEDLKPKDGVAANGKPGDKIAGKATPTTTTTTVAGATAIATGVNAAKPATTATVAAADTAKPVTAKPVATPVTVASAKTAASTEEDAEDAETAATPKPTGGFLYRGQLAVTNLEAVGPKIAEKITALGGRKAGEVELGWQKSEGSAYFHFTIPEAKYGELKEFLAGYGTPRLNLEKHPRVMPDGIVRLIITVDEAKK